MLLCFVGQNPSDRTSLRRPSKARLSTASRHRSPTAVGTSFPALFQSALSLKGDIRLVRSASLLFCFGYHGHSNERDCGGSNARLFEMGARKLFQAAVTRSGSSTLLPSILARSSSLSCRSAAPTFCSTCCGLRAPTIAAVTAGCRSTHATATWFARRPYFWPTFRNRSTRARFFESLGSRNSGFRLRQSLSGSF